MPAPLLPPTVGANRLRIIILFSFRITFSAILDDVRLVRAIALARGMATLSSILKPVGYLLISAMVRVCLLAIQAKPLHYRCILHGK